MTDFQDWLRERHERMVTPHALIDAMVRKAAGSVPVSLRRVVVGQMNEVYDVATAGGDQVIVRVSHDEDPRFEGERWALDAARRAGVPTPRVLLVEQVAPVSFCIEEKLAGIPLAAALEHGVPARAVEQLGALLARLHGVPVDGFGHLRPDGRGWPITFGDLMLDLLPRRNQLLSAAAHWGVPARQVERGLDLLARHPALYGWDTPRLVHGDFAPENILLDGDRISGIVDLQGCAGGHPIWDIVHWDTMTRERIPPEVLLRSYGESPIFDATYEPLFHLVLLRWALWMLLARFDEHNPHGIDHYRRELQRASGFFGP